MSNLSGTVPWVPRWTTPALEIETLLGGIYHASTVYPHYELYASVGYKLTPGFYGPVSVPRSAHIANLTTPLGTALPQILLVGAPASGVVPIADTLGTFLFEQTDPISFYDGATVRLRNLSMVSSTVAASSLTLNLDAILTADPPVPDSAITLKDNVGRRTYYDVGELRSNVLVGVNDGAYTVYWNSAAVLAQLDAGTAYITIGKETAPIWPIALSNIWDEYAAIVGLKRRPGQDNRSLKRACQHLSLSRDPAVRISAALGTSALALWAVGQQPTLSFVGSSASAVEVVGNSLLSYDPSFLYIRERPTVSGSDLLLHQTPEEPHILIANGRYARPNEYSFNENVLTTGSGLATGALKGQMEVHYTSTRYRFTKTGTEVDGLVNVSLDPTTRIVLLAKGVRVTAVTKTRINFSWGREHGILSGSGVFD